jgi:5-methylcytosine-specific restriction endonuclease McrA
VPESDAERRREASRAYNREYYAANAERLKAAANARRAADPDRARARERERYAANRARDLATDAAWRAAHPEHIRQRERERYAADLEASRERGRKKARKHRMANPDAHRTYRREQYAATPESERERIRDYRRQRRGEDLLAARERGRRDSMIRRGYKASAPGYATKDEIAAVMASCGGLCFYCRKAPATDVEHYQPLSRGGSNWPSNLRPSCRPCNDGKGTKWPFEPPVS